MFSFSLGFFKFYENAGFLKSVQTMAFSIFFSNGRSFDCTMCESTLR